MKTPFNMLITGSTECGKTYYLLKMLEDNYKGHFDYIFLICPTYLYNQTYQNWEYKGDDKFFPIPCDQDDVEAFLKYTTKMFSGTNTLIILDDCASSQSVKNRTSEIVRLGFSARHYNLSTIVITQKLTAIAASYRENIAKLIVFDTPSSLAWKTITDEFLTISKQEQDTLREVLKENKYARLEINLRQPRSHSIIF